MAHPLLPPHQLFILVILTRLSAVCGALGSFSILFLFVFRRRYRIALDRPVFYMAMGDLLDATCKIFGPVAVEAGPDHWFCQTQAVLLQFSDIFSLCWAFFISLALLLVIQWNRPVAMIGCMDKRFLPVSLLLSLGAAIPWTIWKIPAKGKVYGDTITWCWVKREYPWVQLSVLYVPTVVVLVWNIFVFVVVGFRVWRTERMVKSSRIRRNFVDYASGVSIYLLIFMLTWMPGFVARLIFVIQRQESFPLLCIRSVLTPMRGLFSFFLYVYLVRKYRGSGRIGIATSEGVLHSTTVQRTRDHGSADVVTSIQQEKREAFGQAYVKARKDSAQWSAEMLTKGRRTSVEVMEDVTTQEGSDSELDKEDSIEGEEERGNSSESEHEQGNFEWLRRVSQEAVASSQTREGEYQCNGRGRRRALSQRLPRVEEEGETVDLDVAR